MENKSIKAERELVKKDNMKLRSQVENLEKLTEKNKLSSNNYNEIVHLTNDLKRKDMLIVSLKEKKKEMKRIILPMKDQFQKVQIEKDKAIRDKQFLEDQIS